MSTSRRCEHKDIAIAFGGQQASTTTSALGAIEFGIAAIGRNAQRNHEASTGNAGVPTTRHPQAVARGSQVNRALLCVPCQFLGVKEDANELPVDGRNVYNDVAEDMEGVGILSDPV